MELRTMGITIICRDSLNKRPIQLTYGAASGSMVPTKAPRTKAIIMLRERLLDGLNVVTHLHINPLADGTAVARGVFYNIRRAVF